MTALAKLIKRGPCSLITNGAPPLREDIKPILRWLSLLYFLQLLRDASNHYCKCRESFWWRRVHVRKYCREKFLLSAHLFYLLARWLWICVDACTQQCFVWQSTSLDICATSLFLVSRRRARDSAANKMLPRIDRDVIRIGKMENEISPRYAKVAISCQDFVTVIGKQGATDEGKSLVLFRHSQLTLENQIKPLSLKTDL